LTARRFAPTFHFHDKFPGIVIPISGSRFKKSKYGLLQHASTAAIIMAKAINCILSPPHVIVF
jgi:hypothetical protein